MFGNSGNSKIVNRYTKHIVLVLKLYYMDIMKKNTQYNTGRHNHKLNKIFKK